MVPRRTFAFGALLVVQGRTDTAGSSAARKQPRVLFVSSHAQLGGSERVLADLLAALPERVVSGVVVLQDGPFVGRLDDDGVPVEVLHTPGSPAAVLLGAARLARVVRRRRPDVIHANGLKAAAMAVLATRRVPVVWMKHDTTLYGRVGRLVAPRCAAVSCVSDEARQGLAGASRTVVVPPGVRVDRELAAREGAILRERLGLTGPVVTVLGRLDPAKGHAELLEALPALRDAVSGVQALLVGGDDLQHPGHREVLRRRAQDLGVTGSTHLLDHLPAHAVLGASDAVCIPTAPHPDGSGREGFGLVAAEALALGVPVVGYDVGATAEVVGPCGELVPQGDRAALVGALVRLLSDAQRARASRECGLERAQSLTVERMAADMLALYQGAAA